jgi:HlyD family secretion protein/epimerase transport system membrane fusion protein
VSLASFNGPSEPTEITVERESAMRSIGSVRRIGFFIVLFFVFGALIWASFAPLALAIMAPGTVVVQGSRRAVQHLEGGIVSEILVKNGDQVKKGQVVLRLARVQSDAAVGVLSGQLDGLLGLQARLIAERDGLAQIAFPEQLRARADQETAREAMAGQTSVFDKRRAFLDGRIEIIAARRQQSERAIGGLEAQLTSLRIQIGLITRELEGVQELYNKGLERKPRLLALQREAADLTGRIGQVEQEIARTGLEISQFDLQVADLRSTYVNEAVQQLRETEVQISEVTNRLSAADDVAGRLDVMSPADGVAVGMIVHALGQVVRPGETVMEVVPQDQGLVVSAQVRPEDSEDLKIGQVVEIYLTAYHQRRLPVIYGKLTYVSADRLTDERTGVPYYEIKAQIDPGALDGVPDVALRAGMPADVAIQTGDSTVLQALLMPLTSVLDRGFREP